MLVGGRLFGGHGSPMYRITCPSPTSIGDCLVGEEKGHDRESLCFFYVPVYRLYAIASGNGLEKEEAVLMVETASGKICPGKRLIARGTRR